MHLLLRPAHLATWAALTWVAPTAIASEIDALRIDAWEFVSPAATSIEAVVTPTADGSWQLAGQPIGYLQTRVSYTNYELHAEWRWTAKPGNAGILLHIDSGPIDRKTWPRCLQVQTKHSRAGDVLPMAGARFAEPFTSPPDAKTPQLDRQAASSEKPAGEWNACDITCREGTVDVCINGVRQNRVSRCVPATGRIGFQFEGAPYELRNVRIEPEPHSPAVPPQR
ncbi:3-keto-disaccharide hydrolase [Opitutus terrae]|uniref:3-keto-alpha-glucoside-1,2-lyase/3-keto-2-hydroxy-glucal hydratase domain-containing protein n=1 Tax=Opitutus terrae (strain DSM 11246 / JCM 15787 / PB90-1) TaxID=452637 RepID=B1ZNM3_OPITP|nr:DUF1080 domain-containing protein [Opitutus terrae]ACB74457.1 hypothetical protein Oter_1169 [Opitutus terrae PB90-1]